MGRQRVRERPAERLVRAGAAGAATCRRAPDPAAVRRHGAERQPAAGHLLGLAGEPGAGDAPGALAVLVVLVALRLGEPRAAGVDRGGTGRADARQRRRARRWGGAPGTKLAAVAAPGAGAHRAGGAGSSGRRAA